MGNVPDEVVAGGNTITGRIDLYLDQLEPTKEAIAKVLDFQWQGLREEMLREALRRLNKEEE